jgi:hypothetical protein
MDGVVVKRMKLVCAMARSNFIEAKKEVVVIKTLCCLMCSIYKKILVRRGASRKLKKERKSG